MRRLAIIDADLNADPNTPSDGLLPPPPASSLSATNATVTSEPPTSSSPSSTSAAASAASALPTTAATDNAKGKRKRRARKRSAATATVAVATPASAASAAAGQKEAEAEQEVYAPTEAALITTNPNAVGRVTSTYCTVTSTRPSAAEPVTVELEMSYFNDRPKMLHVYFGTLAGNGPAAAQLTAELEQQQQTQADEDDSQATEDQGE